MHHRMTRMANSLTSTRYSGAAGRASRPDSVAASRLDHRSASESLRVRALGAADGADLPNGALNERALAVMACVEIKILRRVRAESSRCPPRHRHNACSIAWWYSFLTARSSPDGRAIAEVHPTHWLISTQVMARVQAKLNGEDFGPRLPVAEQVDRLILQATDVQNLCQSFVGWCPFW